MSGENCENISSSMLRMIVARSRPPRTPSALSPNGRCVDKLLHDVLVLPLIRGGKWATVYNGFAQFRVCSQYFGVLKPGILRKPNFLDSRSRIMERIQIRRQKRYKIRSSQSDVGWSSSLTMTVGVGPFKEIKSLFDGLQAAAQASSNRDSISCSGLSRSISAA